MNGKIFATVILTIWVSITVFLFYKTVFKPAYECALLKKKGLTVKAVIVPGGYSEHNSVSPYEFIINGTVYSGGYATDSKPEPGRYDTIQVIYLPENPNISYIREEMSGPVIWFFSLFI